MGLVYLLTFKLLYINLWIFMVNVGNPKNPWDVSRGVKLPPVWRFQGVETYERVWCFHRRGQES